MELAKRIESDFLAVLQLDQDGRLIELATYNRTEGIRRGGVTLPSELASTLVAHAESGPWLDELGLADDVRKASFASADMAIAAGAPIYADDQLVGLLSIGIRRTAEPPSRVRRAQLLAAAIDYASVLSAMAGPAMADRRVARANQTELKRSLAAREFHPVFQPIIDLDSKNIAGYEALTRFDDGTPPDLRFAEAARAGLGSDYELAAIRAAVLDSEGIPPGPFLSLNISPAVLINDGHRLSQLIRGIVRPVVIELTEHTPIADYPTLLAAIARLGEVSMAVDDAGAGFASLRHILELKPAYVKLDISLVRGIDQDATRQALAAGLQYFAIRTDFRLIAEGVETTAEVDALRLIGVDLAQGYLFGRPEPVS
jgi:EAL domain-containing protein (putative c-di-GMP-specific phosphodiesterase class I)